MTENNDQYITKEYILIPFVICFCMSYLYIFCVYLFSLFIKILKTKRVCFFSG